VTPAFIGLGSNLADPLAQLRAAARALCALPQSLLVEISRVYRSAAVGPGEQPDYLNAVALLETSLAPLELLDALQAIERQRGRQRKIHWGARTLDLDLLLYGSLAMDTARLTLPHPRMTERNFVLVPLADVAPANLMLPDGRDLDTLIRACPQGALSVTTDSLLPPA
jgi:2-amino-4-hydroxy-6-hydroxymethyldihydropteridine diphosphokinase